MDAINNNRPRAAALRSSAESSARTGQAAPPVASRASLGNGIGLALALGRAGPAPIDHSRVQALRTAIAEKAYRPDPARIADALIDAGFLTKAF